MLAEWLREPQVARWWNHETTLEAVERDFNEMLGFGAWNQHVRRDFEFEPPEFLLAGEILRGLARPPARDEGEISLDGGFRESFFRMRIKPGAVTPGDVEKQQFRGQGERRHIRGAKPFDTLLQ